MDYMNFSTMSGEWWTAQVTARPDERLVMDHGPRRGRGGERGLSHVTAWTCVVDFDRIENLTNLNFPFEPFNAQRPPATSSSPSSSLLPPTYPLSFKHYSNDNLFSYLLLQRYIVLTLGLLATLHSRYFTSGRLCSRVLSNPNHDVNDNDLTLHLSSEHSPVYD